MEKEFRQKGVATFEGLSIAKNRRITLKVKLRYDEVVTSVELLQGLNSDITIQARLNGKTENLGMFTIGGINFDRDGNAVIPFKSLTENVNLDKITQMVDEEYIQLRFLAVLELPDNTENESEDETEWQD